jgi:putative spermidine/putrescine transport system ATP-binding protein
MTKATSAVAVRFRKVCRHFGDVRAVDDVNLDIAQGEFFALLGPSGSGKTTCLRLIAGFEQPTSGHIEIFGETAEGVPPYKRHVNTVFQDYALFPHMNILDNVGYGLMVKGVDKRTRQAKAEDALKLVALAGYGERRPGQLSGGQRQRVALARALVNEPKVLLLDEPLGALDLKLREQMQVELKGLQRQLGITFVFVTHDQGEALSMADRVAVFNEGKIVQVDTPETIYERPSTRFVANFVGSSNVLSPEDSTNLKGPAKWISLRPERIRVVEKGGKATTTEASVKGVIASVHYQGSATRLHVATESGTKLSVNTPRRQFKPGENVTLAWPKSAMHVLEQQS